MDIVITYVDGNDPLWQQDYAEHAGVPVMQKRFRDWGTLKYLLRGIENCMPFIRNVYLVVSRRSQVPGWVDDSVLKVVLHEDFIPGEYLPTFNCNTLEMHLHRIEGLDEEYLYFNDDMFPVAPVREDDLFRGGKGVIYFSRHWFASGMYKKICRNSDRAARELLGMPSPLYFIRPQHICSPMLRSVCEEVYSKSVKEVEASSTRTRTDANCNQYLFMDYMYCKGLIIPEKISNRHFSVAVASAEKIASFIRKPDRALCCINDVNISDKKFKYMRDTIVQAFEDVFPNKSKYEL